MAVNVNLAPVPKLQFSQNGVPLAGGKLYTYAAGTMTKQATYIDSTGVTPNSNPIKQTLGQGASGIVDHGSAFGLNDRDLSTPYTNSGASPRWVKISYSASVAAGNGMLLTWTVGGVDKGFASVYNTGASSFTLGVTDSMIVPPGSTYEVSINNGSTPVTGVPNFWLEY